MSSTLDRAMQTHADATAALSTNAAVVATADAVLRDSGFFAALNRNRAQIRVEADRKRAARQAARQTSPATGVETPKKTTL